MPDLWSPWKDIARSESLDTTECFDETTCNHAGACPKVECSLWTNQSRFLPNMARAYRERKARLSGPDSVHSSLTLEPTTMRGLEHHLDGSSTACTADLLDPVPSETSPVTKVEESRGPFCACCKIRKSTSDMTSWDGSIEDLSQASSLGCVRCSLLAQVISRFTCGVDHKRSRFKVWTMSDLVELSLQPAGGDYGDSRSMALDVFIGEGKL